MATHWTLGCDAADPARLVDFWTDALGYVAEPGYDDPDGASIIDPTAWDRPSASSGCPSRRPRRTGCTSTSGWRESRPGTCPQREQLIRAKAAELVTAGATTVREQSYGGQFGHIVMLDPEGNEFCVA